MKECSQKPRDTAKPITKGRVFRLNKSSVVAMPVIIQGMLSFHNSTAHALIDIGATHSFASYEFIKNLNLKLESLG